MIRRAAGLLAIAALLLAGSAQAATIRFLWLSDIHFNPLADPKLVDRLAAAEPAEWAAILQALPAQEFSRFGADTNWALFSSALNEIRKLEPKPAFTIVTGDLLVHHFREQFDKTATQHDDAQFRAFVRKTMEFVGLQLQSVAAAHPIYLTLGNNDDECGDYAMQPSGPFLQDTGSLAARLARVNPLDKSFAQLWLESGAYSIRSPLRRHRIVSLNSVFFSSRYRNACGSGDADPAEKELAWLADLLKAARKSHEKIWLIYHIPPGVDGFVTARAKRTAADAKPVTLWKETYAEEFAKLLSEYRDVVDVQLAGHTHVDTYRFFGDAVILIASSLSPITQKSPSFRFVSLDRKGNLNGQRTYRLTDKDNWELEYEIDKNPGLSSKAYKKVFEEADQSEQQKAAWMERYSVSHPEASGITPANFRIFYCASAGITVAEYNACVAHQ